eukprot:jgi/Chrzof1/12087/Cz06g20260.t1
MTGDNNDDSRSGDDSGRDAKRARSDATDESARQQCAEQSGSAAQASFEIRSGNTPSPSQRPQGSSDNVTGSSSFDTNSSSHDGAITIVEVHAPVHQHHGVPEPNNQPADNPSEFEEQTAGLESPDRHLVVQQLLQDIELRYPPDDQEESSQEQQSSAEPSADSGGD